MNNKKIQCFWASAKDVQAHEDHLEKNRYDSALRRRQLSLVLAGKMKANEASELKAIFD